MAEHQEPDLGLTPAQASPFRPVFPGAAGTLESGPVPLPSVRDGWTAPELGPVSIRHSMPADFADMDLGSETAASASQLARRARLQRIVLTLVALLGLFDVVMLWMHHR
jgi:hypothetical protein